MSPSTARSQVTIRMGIPQLREAIPTLGNSVPHARGSTSIVEWHSPQLFEVKSQFRLGPQVCGKPSQS